MKALAHISTPQQHRATESVTILAPTQRSARASASTRGDYTTINATHETQQNQSTSVVAANQQPAAFKAPYDFVATCYGRVESHAAKTKARNINVVA